MSKNLIRGLALAAGLTFGAAGALAQSQQGSSGPQPSGSAGSAQQTTQGQNTARSMTMTQDRLRQTLSQAGFQEVRIVDAAYLVQAKSKQGDTVLMMINSPEMMGGASASPNGTGSTGSHSNTGQGTPNRQ
jgi:hypothetical protein